MPIYDQSYAHWKGRLEGRIFRWLPITSNGLKLVFRRKLLLLLLGLALIPFVVRAGMVVLLHYSETLFDEAPPPDAVKLMTPDGRFYHNFLMINQVFGVIAICLFIGAPLVARDLKAGALEVYFSKPLLLIDYLLGKFMVIAFFLACITLFPALFIFILDLLMSEKPGHFKEVIGYLPGILASSGLIILVCSLVVLAASSLARTARTAAIVWFGFYMALFVISRIAPPVFSNSNLELIDLRTSLSCLSEYIFGLVPTYSWSWYIPLIYILFIAGGSFVILLRRVKGVEVVKS
ncbi:MAG: ABC transporter permease [Planctomycetota bacterium]|jgi:ABC-type transport system involved in multi-copper enzyme maturation permease subunit